MAIIYLVFSFEGVKPKISSDDTFMGNTYGEHPYPFRTRRLRHKRLMILGGGLPGKVSGGWSIILDSSAVEHPAVNRRVVGSNPTRGVYMARWSSG